MREEVSLMKNIQKGFTLIELLAVIVILAIIALIITPVITDVIKNAQSAADLRSAEAYIKAADNFYAESTLDSTKASLVGTNVIDSLEVNNKKATGSVVVNEDASVSIAIVINNKCYKKTEGASTITVSDNVGSCSTVTPAECFSYVTKTVDGITGLAINNYYDYENNNTDIECPRDVVIPSSINGINVIRIYDNAFENKKITSVVIPDTVLLISDSAFYNNQIVSVKIGNNVKTIKGNAFKQNLIASVVIPDSVTYIGTEAFYNNQISDIKLGSGLTEMGIGMLTYNQLTNISIPSNITVLNNHALSYNNLETITIPDSVTSIGKECFYGNKLKSVSFGNSLSIIGISAFEHNVLTNINIPNSVTDINDKAFNDNSLTSVTVGTGLTTLGQSSLYKGSTSNKDLTNIYNGSAIANDSTQWNYALRGSTTETIPNVSITTK